MDWDSFSDKTKSALEGVGRGMMRLFGSHNERIIRRMVPTIQRIGQLEKWAEGLDKDGMMAKVREMREAIKEQKSTIEDCLPETFALVREASRRTLGLRHYGIDLKAETLEADSGAGDSWDVVQERLRKKLDSRH